MWDLERRHRVDRKKPGVFLDRCLGEHIPMVLQHQPLRVAKRIEVRADLRDQPAVRVEVVPLVAPQHHARLGLLVRPLDHRPVGVRVADDLVDGPA